MDVGTTSLVFTTRLICESLIAITRKTLHWLILGVTLFFIVQILKDSWSKVEAIEIDSIGWLILVIATNITLLANI